MRSARFGRADVSLFHEFQPSPAGGGHQFLRALVGELRGRGLTVETNTLSRATPSCLFNSFNFDFDRLRRLARPGCRMVHRVDGPLSAYRGFDDGTDAAILELNAELADATVFQSEYSLRAHRELGLEAVRPRVIPNAVDERIFHAPERRTPPAGRRVRLIASSWSDNPNKGLDTYRWLDEHLDLTRFELTFVGRPPARFERFRCLGPLPSPVLAGVLRDHDVYVAASRNDPCSNALLEALACGLPAVYARSGGHPELVGDGGLGFDEAEEIPAVLERLLEEYEQRTAGIRIPRLADVATRYLEVLGLGPGVASRR